VSGVINFSENLDHLYRSHGFPNQSAFGSAVGINRPAVSRLLTGARPPTPDQQLRIARYFKLQPSDLDLAPEDFLRRFESLTTESNLVFLAFRTTKQNIPRCEEISARYKGDYLIYYPQTEDGTVIASLLSIGRATKEGIEVSLINPHRDSEGAVTAYEYVGYMYPVREFFYFYFEQKIADYEILSLVIHESRTPQVNVLKGIISGVGVLEELSLIAARPIIVLRRRQELKNWQAALGTELGYIEAGRVPEIARRQLSTERITVRV
jgi:transcriptional regulator with XRE-family HTH domain